ncbi:hypothetical protein PCE1_000137 [Barthelona sp. PCE]
MSSRVPNSNAQRNNGNRQSSPNSNRQKSERFGKESEEPSSPIKTINPIGKCASIGDFKIQNITTIRTRAQLKKDQKKCARLRSVSFSPRSPRKSKSPSVSSRSTTIRRKPPVNPNEGIVTDLFGAKKESTSPTARRPSQKDEFELIKSNPPQRTVVTPRKFTPVKPTLPSRSTPVRTNPLAPPMRKMKQEKTVENKRRATTTPAKLQRTDQRIEVVDASTPRW